MRHKNDKTQRKGMVKVYRVQKNALKMNVTKFKLTSLAYMVGEFIYEGESKSKGKIHLTA